MAIHTLVLAFLMLSSSSRTAADDVVASQFSNSTGFAASGMDAAQSQALDFLATKPSQARLLAEDSELKWTDVGKSVNPLLTYAGQVLRAWLENRPVPTGLQNAFVKSIGTLSASALPILVGAAAGPWASAVAQVVAGLCMRVTDTEATRDVAEDVFNKKRIRDIQHSFMHIQDIASSHGTATRDQQKSDFRHINHMLGALRDLVFDPECKDKANLEENGREVPEDMLSKCWNWQKLGAPIMYGAPLAAFHLHVLVELATNLDIENAQNHVERAKGLRDEYLKYLKEAYTAYGVFSYERLKAMAEPEFARQIFSIYAVTKGRDCMFTDKKKDFSHCVGHDPAKCTGKCDVLSSVCDISKFRMPFTNVRLLYIRKSRIPKIRECWSKYETQTLQIQADLAAHVNLLAGFSFH